MEYRLYRMLREPSELVEIAKGIEKCGRPRISAASGIRGFGNPHRSAAFVSVVQRYVKRVDSGGPRQPLLRQGCAGRRLRAGAERRAANRRCGVRVIGVNIEFRAWCSRQQIGGV